MKNHPLILVIVIAVLATGAGLGLSLLFQTDASVQDTPPPARKIVSLMPPITETLFEIGAGDQVIARSKWCKHPPEALDLPTCGSALTPNTERIVELQPHLILANASQATARDKLSGIGRAEFLPWLTAEEMIASTRKLGKLTGHTEEATELADELERELLKPPPKNAPRVLLVIGQDSGEGRISFLRRDSLHGQMLNAAGGVNAVSETVTGVPNLSIERVIELDPDIVIVLEMRDELSDESRAGIAWFWRRIEPLTASRTGRVVVLNGQHFYGAGRRLIRAVRELRAEIKRLNPHVE